MVNQCISMRKYHIFWDVFTLFEANVIRGMRLICIHTSDAAFVTSTNQDWGLLGFRCWSVYDTDAVWNEGYWHGVFIVDSGYPIWSKSQEFWPCIIGNKIIPNMYEYRYGTRWIFFDMITHSLNHNITIMI